VSIRLTWLPNTESDISRYDWQRAPDVAGVPGTWVDLISVAHVIPGPDYDPTSNRFFYVDATGSTTLWYRERAVDTDGNPSGWSDPFQPSESTTPPPFPNIVALNQDYGGVNELQPIDPDNHPLVGVQIRIWKKIDFDLGNYAAAVGTTSTSTEGRWNQPITVEAGFTYVIQFFKPGAFGPNLQQVIVP
jgi:hypothetical protein